MIQVLLPVQEPIIVAVSVQWIGGRVWIGIGNKNVRIGARSNIVYCQADLRAVLDAVTVRV